MQDTDGDNVKQDGQPPNLHLTLIARFDQIIGVLAILGAGWYLLLAHGMLGEKALLPDHFREWTAGFAGFNALMGAFSIWLGCKLLRRRRWARIAQIIFCAGNLPNFPIMTAFGAYAIWALVWGPAANAFRRNA